MNGKNSQINCLKYLCLAFLGHQLVSFADSCLVLDQKFAAFRVTHILGFFKKLLYKTRLQLNPVFNLIFFLCFKQKKYKNNNKINMSSLNESVLLAILCINAIVPQALETHCFKKYTLLDTT